MGKFKLNIPLENRFNKTKIAIILPYFNESTGLKIYEKCRLELLKCGIKKQNIILMRVPGALETPFAAMQLAKRKSCGAIIALGVIIKGKTDHYLHVGRETYRGLMKISLKYDIPIIAGVLTVSNRKQALERINKGKDYARTALLMTQL